MLLLLLLLRLFPPLMEVVELPVFPEAAREPCKLSDRMLLLLDSSSTVVGLEETASVPMLW